MQNGSKEELRRLPYLSLSSAKMNIYNLVQVSDLVRDCSKYRNTSFSDIVYPLSEEINQKINQKNETIRAKAKASLAEH